MCRVVTFETGNSTNAIGSSGVDPGKSLVSIETCSSLIGDLLDTELKSCDWKVLSVSSIFDIHRMMDVAVCGGGMESMLMRPT